MDIGYVINATLFVGSKSAASPSHKFRVTKPGTIPGAVQDMATSKSQFVCDKTIQRGSQMTEKYNGDALQE